MAVLCSAAIFVNSDGFLSSLADFADNADTVQSAVVNKVFQVV